MGFICRGIVTDLAVIANRLQGGVMGLSLARATDSSFNEMMHPNPPQKLAKAGVMIHGNDALGQHCLLVGYNEGRFAKNGCFYVLPKGSIDSDEDPFDAALRETYEETGVDLAHFLGPKNIARIKQGEVLENITHPDFPGVRMLKFDPKPYPHTYHSRAGVLQGMVMYGVEVEGIEHLMPYLKNKDRTPLRELLAHKPEGRETVERPRFPECYQWLRQGYIPADGSQDRVELIDPQYFARLVKRYTPEKKIGNANDWRDFCGRLPKQDYKVLRGCFSAIKKRLLEEGWIEGDMALLKFDEKDCPLYYYAEGACIAPAVEILTKTLVDMDKNADYAKAFGGEGTKISMAPGHRMKLGQVAAYSPFVTDVEWHAAHKNATNKHWPSKGLRAIIEQGLHFKRSAEAPRSF